MIPRQCQYGADRSLHGAMIRIGGHTVTSCIDGALNLG